MGAAGTSIASIVAMTDDWGWRKHHAATLRNLLQRLINEKEMTRPVDPVKAAHLAEAVADVQVLISRLETSADPSNPSDHMADVHAVEHTD